MPEIPALTLEGEITVLEDTVLVRATPGPCNYEVLRSSPTEVVYQCGEVTLSFDRLDPVQRARYTIITLVTERRQVCVQYATDASGRQVCVQSRTEVFERQVPVSRTLRPRRVDGPPVPAHGRRSARARR